MPSAIAVSVVIPSRDCLAYLPAALGSVHLQGVDAEVIVVDDGSTDGTWDWLTAECRLRPGSCLRPIRLYGTGVQRARNRAIEEAQAPLVAFLDADDRWRTGKLAGQIAFHQAHPETLLSFTDYLQVDPDGGEHGSCFRSWPRFASHIKGVAGWRSLGPATAAMMLAENMIGTSTVVARRDVLLAAGGFDVGLASASDWDLWLKVAQLGPIGCTDAVLAEHLIRRPGSISSDHAARVRSMEAIIARHAPVLAVEQPWVIRSALADVAATRAEGSRADGRFWASLASRLHALALAPSPQAARELAAELIRIAAMASMFRRRSVPSGGKPACDDVAKPSSGEC